jgi:hypothetical protein
MRKPIVIWPIAALAAPAQALATPIIRAVSRSDTVGAAYQTLGPNGEVIAHFNHAQRLYLIPY